MTNLIDLNVVVGTLTSFFATGATDAGIEFIKGFTVNGMIKLNELKDELIVKPAVKEALEEYRQDVSNVDAKQSFEVQLTKALEAHPVFNNLGVVAGGNIEIKADKGSVAAGVVSGSITMNNTFK